MTERVKGLIVTFDQPMRADDAQRIMDAISLINGVSAVGDVLSSPADQIVERRVRRQIMADIEKLFA